MEHRIFLTDLHAYNNGALIGDWVDISDFDRDDDNFSQICERCGIKDGHEFFISDYESSFEISEYCDAETLYRLADVINSCDDDYIQAVCDYTCDLEEQIQHCEDEDLDFFPSDDPGYKDLAHTILDEMGELDPNDWKSSYFNYEAYGRDLVLGGDFTILSNGYIRRE